MGALTVGAIFELMRPNYAWAQQGQPERRVGGHPTLSPDDLVEPHGRHPQLPRGRGLRHLEWRQDSSRRISPR